MWLGENDVGITHWKDGKKSRFGREQGFPGIYAWSFAEARDGTFWIACSDGRHASLSHFDPHHQDAGIDAFHNFRSPAVLGDSNLCVALDKTDTVWVGTYGRGLFLFEGQHFVRPPWLGPLTNLNVNSITRDRGGSMWLATGGHGAIRVHDGQVETYRARHDGLISDFVNNVFPDSRGTVWFATDAGVSRFDGTNWTTLARENGLPGNDVRCVN